ncbi:hypothetical protein [Deinococcus fonticola]|uniref:hypothetical protein n=1 Tax=Deinococcus fonticola TaxID=2528713 RepID=UPI0010754DF4|nr:hypothetical protein [Deinococcus fonticola]
MQSSLHERWLVFYAVLALNPSQYISVDEVHDYYPWSRLQHGSIGRMLWRFTTQEEAHLFGQRITHSPAKQATKLFALLPEVIQDVQFQPDQEAVAAHLRNLRSHRSGRAVELSEYTLMLQSGQVEEALSGLRALLPQDLSQNELAHTHALITTALDRLHGPIGTASQIPILLKLLDHNGLNRTNLARILIRLARHHTLCAEYPEAADYYARLKKLLGPQDGLEFCQYHINYALYLRRIGKLEEAIEHTLMAHDLAHEVQWWYGVQATQSNLALMYMHLGAYGHTPAERLNLQKAKQWALKGIRTTSGTLQGADEADIPLLLGCICRNLNEIEEARGWFGIDPVLSRWS